MRDIRQHLEKLIKIERHKHHPLIHHMKSEHGFSKKTLLYVKEYGPHSNVPRTIIRESIKVTLLASVLSSLGGLALENVKAMLLAVAPLIILMPTLNDMIGGYGDIVSSRFATLLYEGKVKGSWYRNLELKKLYAQVFVIALLTAVLSAAASLVISNFVDGKFDYVVASKVLFVSVLDVSFLVNLLFVSAIFAGLYFFRKNEDPDNFLIPITTSIADFGNMLILAVLLLIFF